MAGACDSRLMVPILLLSVFLTGSLGLPVDPLEQAAADDLVANSDSRSLPAVAEPTSGSLDAFSSFSGLEDPATWSPFHGALSGLDEAGPSPLAAPGIDLDGVPSGAVLYADEYDAARQTCTRAENAPALHVGFSPQDVVALHAAAASGRSLFLVRDVELTDVEAPCAMGVASSALEAWSCPSRTQAPDDFELDCSPLDVAALPEATSGEDRAATDSSSASAAAAAVFNVEGRYRVKACCYNWWLTYQESFMEYTYVGNDATFAGGTFLCDANGRHAFIMSGCEYEGFVPGPANSVGFNSEGHYVQPPPASPNNYIKDVGVTADEDGNAGCWFDIGGVYPYDENGPKHKKTCILGVSASDYVGKANEFAGDFEGILN